MCTTRGDFRSSRLQVLREVPAFRGLSARRLAKIDRLVDEVSVAAGHVLAREGTLNRNSLIVISGLAEATRGGRRLGVLGPGSFIGDVGTTDLPRGVTTVTARTPMRLLAVGPAALSTLLEDPAVSRALLKQMVGRLRAADRQVVAA